MGDRRARAEGEGNKPAREEGWGQPRMGAAPAEKGARFVFSGRVFWRDSPAGVRLSGVGAEAQLSGFLPSSMKREGYPWSRPGPRGGCFGEFQAYVRC
jgi:hypothetical protein